MEGALGDGGTLQLASPAPQTSLLGANRISAGSGWWAHLGSVLTCPLLQGWGSCGLSSPCLAVLQGAALVIHTTALELTQQVKKALLVRRWGPGNTLDKKGGHNLALGASMS